MKRLVPLALIILLLVAAAASLAVYQYRQFTGTPLAVGQDGVVFIVEAGDTVRTVLARLEKQGVTQRGWRWRVLGRLQAATIKTGEYRLPPGITPPGLLDLLASGKVVSYRFTIIEGWTVKQLLETLATDPVLLQTLTGIDDLKDLTGLAEQNPEGWFLPETYSFVRGDSDLQLLRRAHVAMQKSLADAWARRDIGLPYETPYELLTMASIIEKETSIEAERADIAGVFVRRLAENWRLEADPTIIYGMGENYQGDIRRRDIRQDTPYNTYTRRGLPPTPIALPGKASLQAAAQPAAGEAMFFVADGQGGHTFSRTLDEHNKAVQQLIKQGKKNATGNG
jgi:UPF0755 protein